MTEDHEIQEFSPTEVRGWLRFLAVAQEPARLWAEGFQHFGCGKGLSGLDQGLQLMRERRLDLAEQHLLSCRKELLETLQGAPPSYTWVFDAWYFSAEAYLHYCRNDMERLAAAFTLQMEALEKAIEAESFLIILAGRFCDVELQKARVARNLHLWEEVHEHLQISREMFESRRPLCKVSRGEVFYSTLEQQVEPILGSDPSNKLDLTKVLDPRWRQRKFNAMVAEVYALPWMLIPFG